MIIIMILVLLCLAQILNWQFCKFYPIKIDAFYSEIQLKCIGVSFDLQHVHMALKRIENLLLEGDSIMDNNIDLSSRGLSRGANSSNLWRNLAEQLKTDVERITKGKTVFALGT